MKTPLKKASLMIIPTLFIVLLGSCITSVGAVGWGMQWTWSFDKKSYAQGESGVCTLRMTNTREAKLRVREVPLVFDFDTFRWMGELDMDKGDSKEIKVSFSIPADLSPGRYHGTLEIHYSYWFREKWNKSDPASSELDIEVTAKTSAIPGFPGEGILLAFLIAIPVILSRRLRSRSTWGEFACFQ